MELTNRRVRIITAYLQLCNSMRAPPIITFDITNQPFYRALTLERQPLTFRFDPEGIYLQSITPTIRLRGHVPLDLRPVLGQGNNVNDQNQGSFAIQIDPKVLGVFIESFGAGRQAVSCKVSPTSFKIEYVATFSLILGD